MGDEVIVELFTPDVDVEELDRMTASLRRELLDIPEVDQVVPATAGPAPAGSRAVEIAAIGALLVNVKPTVELLTKVVGAIRGWLGRSEASTLKITVNGSTLELKPTQEQQEELVRAFVAQAASAT